MSDIIDTSKLDALIPLIIEIRKSDKWVSFEFPKTFKLDLFEANKFFSHWTEDLDWRDSPFLDEQGFRKKEYNGSVFGGNIADPAVFDYLYTKLSVALMNKEIGDYFHPRIKIVF